MILGDQHSGTESVKALIVDDDPDILEVVSLCLEIRWPDCTIRTASNGADGLTAFEKEGADLVILDLGLPDMDGLEVCRRLRASSDVLIIILTVRNQQKDIVRGLEMGADDYITKPFDQMEFLARAQAVLRRGGKFADHQELTFPESGLTVKLPERQVQLRGEVVKLTPTEYNILYHLVLNAGKPMTHRDLLTKVWGQEYAEATDYLKVHIQHLRRKLEDDSENPHIIATERGIGYKFIARPAD